MAACPESSSNLVIYFTVNITFVNYFDHLTKLSDSPVSLYWASYEQVIPISLEAFNLEPDLAKAPKTLKDIVHQIKHKKENI